MSDENQPNPYEDLDAILREAEIACFIDDLGDRVVPFSGEYREWLFWVDVVDGWYSFRTTICKMPTASNLRVNLLTEAMRLNDDLIAAKFSAADWLYLNCAYRASDMDAEDLTKLLKFLVATAEAQYPNLFRVATGDSVLASLEASRKKMRLAS